MTCTCILLYFLTRMIYIPSMKMVPMMCPMLLLTRQMTIFVQSNARMNMCCLATRSRCGKPSTNMRAQGRPFLRPVRRLNGCPPVFYPPGVPLRLFHLSLSMRGVSFILIIAMRTEYIYIYICRWRFCSLQRRRICRACRVCGVVQRHVGDCCCGC